MKVEALALLEGLNFAQLATVNPEGTPHVDTLWFSYENEQMVVATTMATQKGKTLALNPNGFIVVTNKENPYEQLKMKVILSERRDGSSMEICDAISQRYIYRSPQSLTDCNLMGIRSLAAFLYLQFRWV